MRSSACFELGRAPFDRPWTGIANLHSRFRRTGRKMFFVFWDSASCPGSQHVSEDADRKCHVRAFCMNRSSISLNLRLARISASSEKLANVPASECRIHQHALFLYALADPGRPGKWRAPCAAQCPLHDRGNRWRLAIPVGNRVHQRSRFQRLLTQAGVRLPIRRVFYLGRCRCEPSAWKSASPNWS